MPSWGERLRSLLGRMRGRSARADIYEDLRSMALGVDPALIEVSEGERWSGAAVAAMEIGLSNGIATIVTLADGSTSMYLSSGGGVIGAGEHVAVRDAAERFRTAVADSRGLLQLLEPDSPFPRPETGQVRFQARTADGAYTAMATESQLRSGRHPLTGLYAAGQDLITEIRLADPDGEAR